MTSLNHLRRRTGRVLQFLQPQNVYNNLGILVRNESSFAPKRVLIVAKLSRYHFEKIREPSLSDEQLKLKLLERGSNLDAILESHTATENVKHQVTQVLKEMNIEYKIINRQNLDVKNFAWAELVLPIGGDGTFLLAANMIFDNKMPIIGINSHPAKSEGFLLLPPKYTTRVSEIFEKLRAGHYNVLMRSRIRTTIKGENIWDPPFHTHEKGRVTGCEKFYKEYHQTRKQNETPKERRLPWLALNEVFVAEKLSAKTSSLLVKMDSENDYHYVKSSGLCVSTGTGSTSWYRSISSVNPQIVQDLLSIVDEKKQYSREEINKICAMFNASLHFDPEDLKMCYAIRDMILINNWVPSKSLQPRGFCKKLTVRSQCYDAGIVLDGGIAVPFNFGTTAELETHREDSLRTFTLLD